MKIFSAERIRAIDRCTMNREPVASIDLMERAATALFLRIKKLFPESMAFTVICGRGNNGGDGFAIARMLATSGNRVSAYLVDGPGTMSEDCSINFERAQRTNGLITGIIKSEKNFPHVDRKEIVIDAVFGTGINKPVKGLFASVISKMNASGCTIISVDMPSGLPADGKPKEKSVIIHADFTFTFGAAKWNFFFAACRNFTGKWEILDIGWHPACIENEPSDCFLLTRTGVKPLLRKRPAFSHKGLFGQALLLAGGRGKMGAGVLAAKALVRSGAGLSTVAVPSSGVDIMQISVPEAMVIADSGMDWLEALPSVTGFDAVGAGPGIGTGEMTTHVIRELLRKVRVPLVLDADALNIIAGPGKMLKQLPAHSILTPHPGEFRRLTGRSADEWTQVQLLREFAMKYKCYMILKGAYTRVAFPDGSLYFNSTGNPGMAKGGSGDVLTGILTGLLAQGYPAGDACLLGVYLHGLAGDIAVQQKSIYSVLPSDLIRCIGHAYRMIQK